MGGRARSCQDGRQQLPSDLLLLLVAVLVCNSVPTCHAQQANSFLPSGLPALFGGITARLIYRVNGFVENFKDPTVRAVYLADRVVLDPAFWRAGFPNTGGVAPLGPTRPAGTNFTVTSGNTSSEQSRPELNFSGMPNAMLVDKGGYLLFNNVLVSDISDVYSYQYTPYQPYQNQGIGYALWPTISLAPGAVVYLLNVSVAYLNPSRLDNCEQYNRKALFGMRQAYGEDNVTLINATAGNIAGPINITVFVNNGSTNATVGNATAIFENVTFNCLAKRPNNTAPAPTGLSPGTLAAAIVVPIVGALAACLLAGCCIRRRNMRQRKATADGLESDQYSKDVDVEAGSLRLQPSGDLGRMRDQYNEAMTQGGRASAGSNTPSIGTTSSASTLRSFLAIPPETPLMDGILGTRSIHSTGGSSGGSSMRRMHAAAAAGSSAGSVLTTVGSMPLAMVPSSSQGHTPSTQSSSMQRLSVDTHIAAAGMAGSSAGTDSTSMGPLPHTGGTLGNSSGAGTGDRSSGGAGSSGGKPTVAERYAGISSLLKARSDIAVLRELKIGPLLGRGSYGRVYRGRWKATTVAVKIIEHVEGAPGTASSGGKRISVGRESLLATSISHPNVVQTFHISTMTVAQRSALANTWLTDTSGGSPDQTSGQNQQEQADDHSSDDNNSQGSMEAQKDLLETWMIMDFCEKGSLERAVNQGRFIRKADKLPEMVGIYKALLDTASGLDYLHSIGVVHGDLKTANVLLKGSAKDPRGFMCKITDFGLSRVLDLDATHISTATYGTIVYMPKELLLSGRMTQATDIYSFGLMMWELFTSSRVFDEGLSIGQMFYMIAYQDWRPQIPDNCPPGYAELMTACWDEDPEQRPTSQQLLKRLQRLYVQAKQELVASRAAEEAVAGAGAAAAAAVVGGGTNSSDSVNSQSHSPGTGGSGGHGAAANSSKQRGAAAAGAPASGAGHSAGEAPSSGGSMTSSAMGHLSPLASEGGHAEGSAGSALILIGSGASAGGGKGGGAGAGGSGGEGDSEEYRPYAAALLNRKRSGPLASGSAGGGPNTSTSRSSAGRKQLQNQQPQQQPAQQPVSLARGQTNASASAGGVVSYKAGVGSSGTLPGSSEIEVYDDAIPSESLLQNFTSSSNAIQEGVEMPDDGGHEFSGYLAEESESSGRGSSSAGAAGADRSVEMSTLQPRGLGGGAVADNTSSSAQAAAGGSGDGGLQGNPDLARGGSSFIDSFSTGTMPSVLGDSWIGSQSSRSLGGSFFGGSQASSRFPSSMNMGLMPPHSPTHGSGVYAAGPAGVIVGPAAGAPGAAAGSGGGGQVASPFQAAAASGGASGLVPASAAANRSYGTLQTVVEAAAQEDVTGSAPGTTEDVRATLAEGAAAAAPAAAGASPFAALSQRAGSLFGPLKVVM